MRGNWKAAVEVRKNAGRHSKVSKKVTQKKIRERGSKRVTEHADVGGKWMAVRGKEKNARKSLEGRFSKSKRKKTSQ